MIAGQKGALGPEVGMGSFAFRYALGYGQFEPPRPMTAVDFIKKASALGADGVQFCENMGYAEFSGEKLDEMRKWAEKLGLFVELGMHGLSRDRLQLHLELASRMNARCIRAIAGQRPEGESRHAYQQEIVELLCEFAPELSEQGLKLGLENHFDFTTGELVEIVEEVDEEHIGLVYDTTNCLGFIEEPEETLEAFTPHILAVHLKDYVVEKVDAGYLISGTVLGEGLLNTEQILKRILDLDPRPPIILEMSIARDEEQNPEEVIEREHVAVENSISFLRRHLDHLVD